MYGIFINLGPKTFPFLSLGTGRSHDFQHPDIMDTRKYMHAETLADKTIVFSEREVFKVVVMVTQ